MYRLFSDDVQVNKVARQIPDILPQDRHLFFSSSFLGSFPRLVSCVSLTMCRHPAGQGHREASRWGEVANFPYNSFYFTSFALDSFITGSTGPERHTSRAPTTEYSGVSLGRHRSLYPMPLPSPALIKLASSTTISNLYTLQTLDSLHYSPNCRHVYHIPFEPAQRAVVCASFADSTCSAFDPASRQSDSSVPPP